MSLFIELKRRNVFRVGLAYVVTGWLLMQVGEVMAPALRLPDWVLSALAFFLVLGLPLVLIFAWVFELTPEGLKRESEVDRSTPGTQNTRRKLDLVIIALLVAAIAFLLFEKFRPPAATHADTTTPASTTAVSPPTAAPVQNMVTDDGRKAIAVLPFQNLSTDEENAFFAAGVHEDILTYLSRVAELRVNSRTSVQQYAERKINLKDVAAELGARYIVEGSVRRAGNQVRITAQLIDANTDEHLWAENFDRELTDIFAIQTQVAEQIVAALEAELSPREAAMLERPPTDSIEAYDLYLRARQNMQIIGFEQKEAHAELVVGLLEQAVALDPEFSRAWALLAVAHGETYWFLADRSPARLIRMRYAVEQARALEPLLPEGLMAQALYHYRGFHEYPQALEALQQARSLIPNDPLVHFNLGLTLRRLGRYDESIDAFLKAAELAPDGSDNWGEALNTAVASNRLERAEEIVLAIPVKQRNAPRLVGEIARFHLLGQGDVARARALLDSHPEADNWYELAARLDTAMAEHRYAEAARIAVQPAFSDTVARGYGRVIAALALELDGRTEEAQRLRRALALELAEEVAQPYAETYAWPHLVQALNLVRMGETEAALASCRRAMDIMPIERDKVHGLEIAESCAWVKAQAGRVDEALDDLERSRPVYNMGPRSLSLMPEWDFLRGNARFQALAEQGEMTK